jgi:hypothetical protein
MSQIQKQATGTTRMHKGLTDLFAFPFMSCLTQRRTRRVARGASISAGPLGHTSTNDPAPLSKPEEAVLIVYTPALE